MLVSLRAGGVGLNLVGGNHIFLMDMHWFVAIKDIYTHTHACTYTCMHAHTHYFEAKHDLSLIFCLVCISVKMISNIVSFSLFSTSLVYGETKLDKFENGCQGFILNKENNKFTCSSPY
jgi:hypothetical protein